MSSRVQTDVTANAALIAPKPDALKLQRKCDCGQHTISQTHCDSCRKGRLLQRSATDKSEVHEVPPVVNEVLQSSGQPLDSTTRNYFEQRFRHDFSRVRVHTDQRAAESAAALGARAFTSNESVVFADQHYRPETHEGRHLLAHELAHVVQQENSSTLNFNSPVSSSHDPSETAADSAANHVMSNAAHTANPSAQPQAAIQRTVDDPKRFQEVHDALFVAAPAPSGGAKKLQPWVDPDPAKGEAGTAEALFKQAKANFQAFVKANPAAVSTKIKTQTTEADLDTDAVDVSDALKARFPFISISVTDAQIKAAVSVMTPALTSGQDYLREWMANKLPGWSDVENFSISETDPRFIALLDRLLADTDIGPDLKAMATKPSGFQRGQGQKREIFIHRGTDPQMRKKVLFHELTHFYAHPIYREWVATTVNERWYNEGFTEYIARMAMPAPILKLATSYQDRVDSITKEVAAHVPDDDIARAFFRGEIWRIETRSKIARREVGTQLGLKEGATEKEEQEASRIGPGINETVVPGQRYRFMNLGFDRAAPKPEHITFFHDIKTEHLDPAPGKGVIFEGHASTAGTLPYNLELSLKRAKSFYQMARDQGLTSDRLIKASDPPHFGETKVTAEEEDPATRAFNRRVEMQIQPVSSKP